MTLPAGVQPDFPLARLTTIRAGGHADFYARPDSPKALAALLAWAGEQGARGRSGGIGIEPADSG